MSHNYKVSLPSVIYERISITERVKTKNEIQMTMSLHASFHRNLFHLKEKAKFTVIL